MKIKHQTFCLILTIFQFAHPQNENIQYLHYHQRRTIGMLNQVYYQTSFFFFFSLKEEVKYEALNMPQDQYRVATWLQTAMEQNNPVLILCVCVCVYSAALQLLPLPSDRSIWSMNCVAARLHCPIFSLDIAASRKKQWGKMDAQSPCALWVGLESNQGGQGFGIVSLPSSGLPVVGCRTGSQRQTSLISLALDPLQ